MAVSKAEMDEKKPVEYQEGARRAREARQNVGSQLAGLIATADLTGSQEYVALRIRGYADALRTGDDVLIRSALMDLGTAAGATAAAIDIRRPIQAAA